MFTAHSTPGVALMCILMGLIALVYMVDEVALDQGWRDFGIWPRRSWGLFPSVFNAPILHFSLEHIVANSGHLLLYGGAIALADPRSWLVATPLIIVLGGLLTWAIARDGNHAGASGLVYGYMAYAFLAPCFGHASFGGPVLVGVLIADILWQKTLDLFVKNRPRVSHEGHLAGALAGALAVWLTPLFTALPAVDREVQALSTPGLSLVSGIVVRIMLLFMVALLLYAASEAMIDNEKRQGSATPWA